MANWPHTFEVELVETYGWKTALRALRRPMNKEPVEVTPPFGYAGVRYWVPPEDLRLSSTLKEKGDDHAKVLRMIGAGLTIKAPRYWWVEMDTYRIGVEKVSESTMHWKMSQPFLPEDFEDGSHFHSDLLGSAELVDLNIIRQAVKEGRSPIHHLKQEIPESFLQTRDLTISYQTFRRIYGARKDHKLPHWHDFCAFIETLPYAEALIL